MWFGEIGHGVRIDVFKSRGFNIQAPARGAGGEGREGERGEATRRL